MIANSSLSFSISTSLNDLRAFAVQPVPDLLDGL
jgi:hypothetical protein